MTIDKSRHVSVLAGVAILVGPLRVSSPTIARYLYRMFFPRNVSQLASQSLPKEVMQT